MRTSDFFDYFVLRRYLTEPWAFLRTRKQPPSTPLIEVPLKNGDLVRMRTETHDRHVFHRVFARDQYRLDPVAPGSLDTVVDIGAHIGSFALRAAPLARQVFSFEPTPDTFELLSGNVSKHPNVKPFQFAVAGKTGTMTLHLGVSPDRNTLFLKDERQKGSVEVRTTTLEEIFRQNNITRCDLLKLDCEGAEYDVLYNAPDDLWPKIRRTCLEYHYVEPARDGWNGKDLAAFLTKKGHRVELVAPTDKGHNLRKQQGYIFSELA
jgi:FkbM family methyltransferase